jgi:hypothetical protein
MTAVVGATPPHIRVKDTRTTSATRSIVDTHPGERERTITAMTINERLRPFKPVSKMFSPARTTYLRRATLYNMMIMVFKIDNFRVFMA